MVIHANNKIGKKYVKENFTLFLPIRKKAEIKKTPNKKLLIAIEIGKVINNNNKGIKALFCLLSSKISLQTLFKKL